MFEPRSPDPDLKISLWIASMDKYKRQQQHESDFRGSRPVDEDRRTKARKEKEITEINSSSGSSSLFKQPQPHGGIGGGSIGQSPRTGFDPQTDDTLYKTSVRRSSSLPRRRPENENKTVNWRLACFLAHEYLTGRTLLGSQWPPQDSNSKRGHGNSDKPNPKFVAFDKDTDEKRNDKERVYHTLADSLRTGDVHLPGIVNPSQLASWVGLN